MVGVCLHTHIYSLPPYALHNRLKVAATHTIGVLVQGQLSLPIVCWITVQFEACIFAFYYYFWSSEHGKGRMVGMYVLSWAVQMGRKKTERKEGKGGRKGSSTEFNAVTQVSWFAGSWFNLKFDCLHFVIWSCGNPVKIKLECD